MYKVHTPEAAAAAAALGALGNIEINLLAAPAPSARV